MPYGDPPGAAPGPARKSDRLRLYAPDTDLPATRAQADDIIALLRQLHAAVTQLGVTMRALGGRHL